MPIKCLLHVLMVIYHVYSSVVCISVKSMCMICQRFTTNIIWLTNTSPEVRRNDIIAISVVRQKFTGIYIWQAVPH